MELLLNTQKTIYTFLWAVNKNSFIEVANFICKLALYFGNDLVQDI